MGKYENVKYYQNEKIIKNLSQGIKTFNAKKKKTHIKTIVF